MDKMSWPDAKRFAFTIFDDTDDATLDNAGPVYSLLSDLGFRTTKSCWVVDGDPAKAFGLGQTCDDPAYREWVLELQSLGFEIGWHSSTWNGLTREGTLAALDRFAEMFGHYPFTAAHHSRFEGVYWGPGRVTGWNRLLYNLLTRFRERGEHRGHVEGSEYFWGDACKKRIKYYRNLVFSDVNTLKACPVMPYYDPKRPFVNYWYASSEGARVRSFCECVSEENQDRLEQQRGACIMYTHFANGFCENGRLDKRFQRLMERLAAKDGWFVPAADLLDHILEVRGHYEITNRERAALERKWLWHKVRVGTT